MKTDADRQAKIRFIAERFMEEDPVEYEGETVEEVMKQLECCSDDFVKFTYETYRSDLQ